LSLLSPTLKSIAFISALMAVSSVSAFSQTQVQSAAVTAQQLKNAQQEVQKMPRDAKLRYEYAELLRKSGDLHKGAVQYLEVTSLDPTYYLAYHKLTQCQPSNEQLDEAIERLNKLEELRPKELMMRVALSEVLEKKGELYKAARALVDLQYSDVIPPKYIPKVNARIHFLLSKAKDVQTQEKSQQTDEELDSVPLPIPEGSGKDMSASKLKDSKVTEGYGHTKLLP
jgi:tetratricopeptide (TPR) repeat protein